MIIAGKISIHPQKEQKLDSIFNPNLLNKNCNFSNLLDFRFPLRNKNCVTPDFLGHIWRRPTGHSMKNNSAHEFLFLRANLWGSLVMTVTQDFSQFHSRLKDEPSPLKVAPSIYYLLPWKKEYASVFGRSQCLKVTHKVSFCNIRLASNYGWCNVGPFWHENSKFSFKSSLQKKSGVTQLKCKNDDECISSTAAMICLFLASMQKTFIKMVTIRV